MIGTRMSMVGATEGARRGRGVWAMLWALPAMAVLMLTGCGGAKTATDAAAPSTGTTGTTGAPTSGGGGKPITIGYSDWPGWAIWDVVNQKGFFEKHGVNVKMVWFPNYSDSLNALSAGQVDANSQVWSDTMAPLAQGQDLKVIIVNDNSTGNDAIIGKPGINSLKDLKGKKVASELGTCDHYMLLQALEKEGMSEKDIQFTNIKIQDCPSAMLAGQVDAAAVWEPSRTKLLQNMKGSKELYTSRQMPGLLPDLLVARGELLKDRADETQKIVMAYYEALDWIRANKTEAVKIMAKRSGMPIADYNKFIGGMHSFSAPEGLAAMTKNPAPTSLYSTGQGISEFLLKAKQVSKVPDWQASIEPKFVKAAVAKGLAKLPPFGPPLKS